MVLGFWQTSQRVETTSRAFTLLKKLPAEWLSNLNPAGAGIPL
jgi:hypothetical protein